MSRILRFVKNVIIPEGTTPLPAKPMVAVLFISVSWMFSFRIFSICCYSLTLFSSV